MKNGLKTIDYEMHVMESMDLWENFMPPPQRATVPGGTRPEGWATSL